MYVDPNVVGVLFQALSVAAGAVLGLVLAISRQKNRRVKQRVRLSRQQEVVRPVRKD